MAALRLPSSAMAPVPRHSQAYPFKTKQYGGGVFENAFNEYRKGGWKSSGAPMKTMEWPPRERRNVPAPAVEADHTMGGMNGYGSQPTLDPREWQGFNKLGYGMVGGTMGVQNGSKTGRGIQGGSSSFFRNRVRNGRYTPGASEAPATAAPPAWTQHDPNAVSGDLSGSGYMGPGGWVNTQNAAPELEEKINPDNPRQSALSMAENQATRQWGQAAMPDRGQPMTTHAISPAPIPTIPKRRKGGVRRKAMKRGRGKKGEQ